MVLAIELRPLSRLDKCYFIKSSTHFFEISLKSAL